jgi:predicted AAA+ superfamily ATPase
MIRTTDERYRRRIVDDELDALLAGGASAIALEGAKAVGKTATAAERVDIEYRLEDPATRELVAADPGRLADRRRVLIDEWQHVPPTWDVVRRDVDAGASAGQFFLTGSASGPRLGVHSGAGRILRVVMRPMSLVERGVGAPTVSLASLLAGDHASVGGDTDVTLDDYVEEIVRSGFPGIRDLDDRVRRAQLRGYIDRVIDRDFPDVMDRRVRNPPALRRWLAASAAATASTASYEKVRDAATSGEGYKPSRSTTRPYQDALEALFVADPLPAWSPTRSHIAELGEASKHHLADPALAASILGLGADALLRANGPRTFVRDGSFLGALFESLVTLNVRVFAQGAEATVGHLRTHRDQREVDLIVEGEDRRVVAIEVKLGATVDDRDVRNLLWLRGRIGDDLVDAAVVTTGPFAYRRPDGIAVIPAALLGP